MIHALDSLVHTCRLVAAAGALALLATTAHAAPCYGTLDGICSSHAFSAYAQYNNEDSDDEDDEGDEDDDEDEDDEFIYDEDQGSLLVDIEDCEPGKYWMMDTEDGVMLPCK